MAEICVPLNALLKKGVHFRWNEQCEKAFRSLIDSLVNEVVLCYPNFDKEFVLQTDASDHSLGYVLSQEHEGSEVVIAFGGRFLNVQHD